MKKCNKCNIEKQLNEFSKDSKGKYGVKGQCKQCIKEYDKEKNIRNKSIYQQYYLDNKEKINKKSKETYNKNKQYYIEKNIKYGKDNPDVRRRSTAKYLKTHPEYQNQYRKNRYNTNPQFKLRIILGNRLNEVLKKNKTYKTSNIITLLGCTLDEVKQHLEKQFINGMSWENHGDCWEIDHIIPCDFFDLTNIYDQQRCFHYVNLQPLNKTENRIKSNKIL
jgi:hypothetical protein